MNVWTHVKIGGSVMMMVGAILPNLVLSLIGFMVFIFAMHVSVIILEQKVQTLEKGAKNEKDEA